ncbi:DivIVA domain-containing protein [Scopulibacillus darangshiensis]|uniref:Cell cycle protein GpsB n=1 Tax=Scopulibacillus darangshiensis TaxID=442528 RepID=A0A4R2PB62_9BACL|nr:cell division regulator GpsB [Scopulibacillus darangshiensis]TCP31534.1 DivIVA domain-containing protein [Scopulibacillus darangshiensis]
MENKISQFTSQDILDKEFKTGLRGYQPEEVDKFLDDIIKDYQAFNKEISRLQQENQRLKQDMSSPKPEQRRPLATQGQTNYDILKRLSNLEKHVFGSRLSD